MALDLTEQSTIDYILGRVQEAIKYDDKKAAQEVLHIFRKELPTQQQAVAEVQGLYEKYKKAWIAAQFIFLPSIPEDDFFELIKEHLTEGLQLEEYDFIDKVGKRISFMDLEGEQVDFMNKLLDVLKKSNETLGKSTISVGNRPLLPTIANWLSDYDLYPSKKAQKTQYEEVEYVSKSPNTSQLSEIEKQVLLDILECYDSLRNILAHYRSLPDATEQYINDPENYYQFIKGATLVDSVDEVDGSINTEPVNPAEPAAPIADNNQTTIIPEIVPVSADKTDIEPTIQKSESVLESQKDKEATNSSDSYIIEEQNLKKDSTIETKPTPNFNNTDVGIEIKKNLGIIDRYAPARLNIQDMLNERHNKEGNRGGLVLDNSNNPNNSVTDSQKTAQAQTNAQKTNPIPAVSKPSTEKPLAPIKKPNLPDITELELPAPQPEKALPAGMSGGISVDADSKIAEKLAALKQRKQSN